MRGSLKYWLLLASSFALAFVLSYLAFYSFFFATPFHSVPVLRACDTAGSIVLLPASLLFRLYGGLFDQSMPYSDPLNYITINAVLLGFLIYSCLRPLVFRAKKPAK